MEWKLRKPKIPLQEADDIYTKLAKINGIYDAERFLNPSSEDLHDPYLLKNIKKAKRRILKALYRRQNIVIVSDPDTDGVSSAAIMFNYLKRLTPHVQYLYHQRAQGHGILHSKDRIPSSTGLLIIVDSSSSDTELCKEIAECGIDVIILDHHPIEQGNPYCILVNPQQPGCNYPNKEASGSLICWKMCNVLDDALQRSGSSELLDLAGIGLYSDRMSMTEKENRYIISMLLANVHNVGMKLLIRKLNMDLTTMTSADLAYTLIPVLNSATRLNRIEIVLELLTCEDARRCNQLVHELLKLNNQRKREQYRYLASMLPLVKESDSCSIVIHDAISPGFRGLIASELTRIARKPVIVLSQLNATTYAGSYRSCQGYNLKELLGQIPEVISVVGHPEAGGIVVEMNDVPRLQRRLNERLENTVFNTTLEYDLDFDASELTEPLIRSIERFYRISGKHVPIGKFLIRNLWFREHELKDKGMRISRSICSSSLKSAVKVDLEAIKFKPTPDFIKGIQVPQKMSVVGSLNMKHRYHESKIKQIIMDDYEVTGS